MSKVLKGKRKAKDEYRHGSLKMALMQAAIHSIQQTGEVEFSLRELAAAVGVSHAAAYRHFKSKKEILFDLAREGFDRLNVSFSQILDKDPGDIVSLGVAYVTFAAENPIYFKIMFHPDLKIDSSHPELISVGSKTFLYLKECVRINKENGIFSDISVENLSLTAWSTVHGLAVLCVNGNLSPLPDGNHITVVNTSKIVARVLVDGLLRRSSKRE